MQHEILSRFAKHAQSARRLMALAAVMLCAAAIGWAQSALTGTVTDEFGDGLIGVNVMVKGTTVGTITDIDGNYSLQAQQGQTLVFSYVGYTTQEAKVAGQRVINVKMSEDNQALEETVVVGFASQKKVNLTGAVAAIDSKAMENRGITSVAAGMQGTMPGVTIVNRSGQPGLDDSGTTVRVRGTGTFNNAAPMIVVDGMESPCMTSIPTTSRASPS